MKELFIKIVKRILRIILSIFRFVIIRQIIYFPNLARENKSKNIFRKRNPVLYNLCEKIFLTIQKRRFKFRGWSLAKSAIRYTILELFTKKKESVNIVELGGGVSSFFWYYLKKELNDTNFQITTFEHDKDWGKYLIGEIGDSINISLCNLKQLSDNERVDLFDHPSQALTNWQKITKYLPEDQYKNTKARHCFYDIPKSFLIDDDTIDLLIVDGPHGNGRSMCFPLFQKKIKQGTIILLDDYNHYPFVEDLKSIFQVEVIAMENSYSKKWILLKII